jgi:hypothetical protein
MRTNNDDSPLLTNAFINNGSLSVKFSDGKVVNLGSVTGKNGLDGKDGKDGRGGRDGKDGVRGERGEKGEKGDKGELGEKGDRGDKGDTVKDGKNGIDGKDGEKGDRGDKGDRGEKGEKGVRGERGEKGERGKDGKDGKDGRDGKDGEIKTIVINKQSETAFYEYDVSGNRIRFRKPSGEWDKWIFISRSGGGGGKGEKGDKGDTGDDGLNGWTAELAVIADGERRVQQIVDWFGGTGTKPETGKYIGSTGLVDLIADAVDIRGVQGVAPDNVLLNDGSVPLVANWDAGDYEIESASFTDGEATLSGGNLDSVKSIKFSVDGDNQVSYVVQNQTTSDATPTEMFQESTEETSERIIVPSNKMFGFTIHVSAADTTTGTVGSCSRWKFDGILKNIDDTVSMVGSAIKILIANDSSASAWDVSVTADNINKSLKLTVTGESDKTIRWLAKVELEEISF